MLLIKNDLTQSLASLTIWVESYSTEKKDDSRTRTINDSLFRDGITQFVNCFDSKNAFPLVVETVFPNIEGIAPYFRWLRDLRNSYAAHRHGNSRQCSVGAIVDPSTGAYLGHTALYAAYRGPNQEGHAALLSLVAHALHYVEAQLVTLGQRFDAEASAIAPAVLLKLPRSAVQPQGPEQMGKSRGDVMKAISRGYDEPS